MMFINRLTRIHVFLGFSLAKIQPLWLNALIIKLIPFLCFGSFSYVVDSRFLSRNPLRMSRHPRFSSVPSLCSDYRTCIQQSSSNQVTLATTSFVFKCIYVSIHHAFLRLNFDLSLFMLSVRQPTTRERSIKPVA